MLVVFEMLAAFEQQPAGFLEDRVATLTFHAARFLGADLVERLVHIRDDVEAVEDRAYRYRKIARRTSAQGIIRYLHHRTHGSLLESRSGSVFGSSAILMNSGRRARNKCWRVRQDAGAQQVESGSAIHLSLDRLQPINLALYLAGAPRRLHGR